MKKDRIPNPTDPPCAKKDCFANKKGVCAVLTDSYFSKRDCPFFKKKGTVEI